MTGTGADETQVDFDVCGLLRVRLVDPSADDVRTVRRHLGLRPDSAKGDAGLTIRFVDRLKLDGPLRRLGRDDVGFTDTQFVLLRSRNLARARSILPFDRIGQKTEIICEKGLPAIPLFSQLLNMTMLARGVLPVHSAAFTHQDRGMLVTGWSHGSKTGTLLAFMAAGAKFVGDEWVFVGSDGRRMHGLPNQFEARPWYLAEIEKFRRHAGRADRARVATTGGLARLLNPLVDRSERHNSLAGKLVRGAHQSLVDQQSIHMDPVELFGEENCVGSSPLDIVVIAISNDSPTVDVEPVAHDQLARQMAASFVFEQSSLFAAYQKQLFAFPDRRNPLFDDCERIYRELAAKVIAETRSFRMLHPYPVAIGALQSALQPLFSQRAGEND